MCCQVISHCNRITYYHKLRLKLLGQETNFIIQHKESAFILVISLYFVFIKSEDKYGRTVSFWQYLTQQFRNTRKKKFSHNRYVMTANKLLALLVFSWCVVSHKIKNRIVMLETHLQNLKQVLVIGRKINVF